MAYWFSGGIHLAIRALPFRWITPLIGTRYHQAQLSVLATQQKQLQASRIGQIIHLAGKYTPWECKCLAQAIITSAFLKYYKIPYIVHLGVTKGAKEMKAHAWLHVSQQVITGRQGHQAFTIVSTFVAPGVLPHRNIYAV